MDNTTIIQVSVTGMSSSANPCIFKTVVLKSHEDILMHLTEADTKYVIKWIFDLNGQTLIVPPNCILDFDGGQIKNGSIIWSSTKVLNRYQYEILSNITESGERIDL